MGGVTIKYDFLTPSGWKSQHELTIGDPIMSFDIDKNIICDDIITKKILFDAKKNIQFKNGVIEFDLHPSQKVIYSHVNGNILCKEIGTLVGKKGQLKFKISGYKHTKYRRVSYNDLRLMGWIISEGHFKKDGGHKNAIMLFQKETSPNCDNMRRLLYTMNIDFTEHKWGTETVFYIKAKSGKIIREKLINTKNIPDFGFLLSSKQINTMLETLMAGDGHWECPTSGTYYSSNDDLIDRLQAILVMAGWRTRKFYKKSGYTKKNNPVLGICKRDFATISLQRYKLVEKDCSKCMVDIHSSAGTIICRLNGRTIILHN